MIPNMKLPSKGKRGRIIILIIYNSKNPIINFEYPTYKLYNRIYKIEN